MIGHLLLVIKPFVGTPRTCTVAPIIFVTTLSLLLFTHSAFASPPSDIGIEGKPAISDIINETIYERLGNTAEALSDYDGVLALNPNYAIAYSSRGNQYYSRGMYKEALQDFDRAIDLDPKLAVAYEYRGKTYAKLKEFDKAIKDLDTAVGLEPSRGWTYVYRGIARVELGKLPDAIKDFDKAIALNPKYEGTYAYRGGAYRKLKKYDEAISDFDKAIALNPKYEAAFHGRGVTYAQLGNYNRAIEDFGKAIELDPKRAGTYNNRGMAFDRAGMYDRALNDFTKALELSPLSPQAHNALSWFYATCRDASFRNGEKAVNYGETAVSLAEKSKGGILPALYDTLAAAYAEFGDFEKAVEMESKAYDLYTSANAEDRRKEEFAELIRVYGSRQTYVQWKYGKAQR